MSKTWAHAAVTDSLIVLKFLFREPLLNIYPLGACKGHTEPYMNTVHRPPMLFLVLMAPLQDEQSTIET